MRIFLSSLGLGLGLVACVGPAHWTAKQLDLYRYRGGEFSVEESPFPEEDRGKKGASYDRFMIWYPSPVQSDEPLRKNNNRVQGWLYVPHRPNGRAVIVLPIWKERIPNLEGRVAQFLARKGFLALIMAGPYQFGRTPPGYKSGALSFSEDLDRNHESAVQAIQDLERARAWIERDKGIPRPRIGIVGISLGGALGGLACAVLEDPPAAVLLRAGADLSRIVWAGTGAMSKIRRRLEQEGWTPEKLRQRTRWYDAVSFRRPDQRERILLINRANDELIPMDSSKRLQEVFGGARMILLPGGHSSFFHFDLELKEAEEHLLRQLR